MPWPRVIVSFLLWATLDIFGVGVRADGIGILGAGKWLYRPTCAHACRRFIRDSPLVCDGTSTEDYSAGAHSHTAAPSADCYLSNTPFLRTMALCLSTYCATDNVPLSTLQKYWEGHLATGTLSDPKLKPALPYYSAWRDAQSEEESRELSYLVSGEELNQTMAIYEEDFIAMYNHQKSFEYGEVDHGRNRYLARVSCFSD